MTSGSRLDGVQGKGVRWWESLAWVHSLDRLQQSRELAFQADAVQYDFSIVLQMYFDLRTTADVGFAMHVASDVQCDKSIALLSINAS